MILPKYGITLILMILTMKTYSSRLTVFWNDMILILIIISTQQWFYVLRTFGELLSSKK